MNKKLIIAVSAGAAAAALALGLGLGLGLRHKHTFKEDWSNDETNHWHEATCGHDEVADKAEHTLENGKCTVCGYNTTIVTEDQWKAALDYFNITMDGLTDESVILPTVNLTCTQQIICEGESTKLVLGLDYDKNTMLLNAGIGEQGYPDKYGAWQDGNKYYSTGKGWHSENGEAKHFYSKEEIDEAELTVGFKSNIFSYAGGMFVTDLGIYEGYELFTYSQETKEYTATITIKDWDDNDMSVNVALQFENGKLVKLVTEDYYDCVYTHTYEYNTTTTIPQFLLNLEIGDTPAEDIPDFN